MNYHVINLEFWKPLEFRSLATKAKFTFCKNSALIIALRHNLENICCSYHAMILNIRNHIVNIWLV